MKKLIHLTFAIALILSVTYTSFATTWADTEVVCPVCKQKNTFKQIVSFGNYIYQWPSKFQYIYWPLTDSPVLYSCSKCHYTAFMWDFQDAVKDKLPEIRKLLENYPFEGVYAKYTDIPMSKRLAIAEKVYSVLGMDDDWWCRFERTRGYHFAGEKKETEAAEARKKALALAEKMLRNKPKSPSEKELYLITGGMKYFLKDQAGALKDLEHGLTLKFESAEEKEKAANFDKYLSDVMTEFIAAIRDEEKAKTEPVWPHSVLQGHDGWVMTLAYAPDGNSVASADIEDGLILWDARTGKSKHTFADRNVIQRVAFSPDSKLLASGGYNKTIDIWDVKTDKLLKILEGHENYVHALAFSPDGKLLASGSWDTTVKIWNASTWTATLSLPHPESVWDLSFSPDGATLATIDAKGTIRLWDTKSGNMRRQFSPGDKGGFVTFSPDGKLLAVQVKHDVALIDSVTGNVVRKLEGHRVAPQAAAFSPDGKRLASVAQDGTLRLWNVATGEMVDILTQRGGRFRDVKFASDGLVIATASEDHTVRLWDVRPGVKAVKPEPAPR